MEKTHRAVVKCPLVCMIEFESAAARFLLRIPPRSDVLLLDNLEVPVVAEIAGVE